MLKAAFMRTTFVIMNDMIYMNAGSSQSHDLVMPNVDLCSVMANFCAVGLDL